MVKAKELNENILSSLNELVQIEKECLARVLENNKKYKKERDEGIRNYLQSKNRDFITQCTTHKLVECCFDNKEELLKHFSDDINYNHITPLGQPRRTLFGKYKIWGIKSVVDYKTVNKLYEDFLKEFEDENNSILSNTEGSK